MKHLLWAWLEGRALRAGSGDRVGCLLPQPGGLPAWPGGQVGSEGVGSSPSKWPGISGGPWVIC